MVAAAVALSRYAAEDTAEEQCENFPPIYSSKSSRWQWIRNQYFGIDKCFRLNIQ